MYTYPASRVRSVSPALLVCAALAACGDETKGEEGLVREDLGKFTTDADGGVEVPFDVPDDAVSTLVTCGPYGYDVLATADLITDPDGKVLFDDEDPEATAMRVNVEDDLLPILLPVSPDLDLRAGAHALTLYVDSESPVTVSCGLLHRIQPVADETTVDVKLVFVGVDGVVENLNGQNAKTVPELDAALDEVKKLWAKAGITLGEVLYEDFSGDVDTYTEIDSDKEFGDLLRTVEIPGDRRITYFFVQGITADDGATILGLAAGPPGAAATGATSKSGVVVTVAAWDEADPAGFLGRLMAHEGGHFLGLYHPTEKDGSGHDPLADTPECADGNGDGTVSTSECGSNGADNLMWWAASESAVDMSADQGWVMSRSAAAR